MNSSRRDADKPTIASSKKKETAQAATSKDKTDKTPVLSGKKRNQVFTSSNPTTSQTSFSKSPTPVIIREQVDSYVFPPKSTITNRAEESKKNITKQSTLDPIDLDTLSSPSTKNPVSPTKISTTSIDLSTTPSKLAKSNFPDSKKRVIISADDDSDTDPIQKPNKKTSSIPIIELTDRTIINKYLSLSKRIHLPDSPVLEKSSLNPSKSSSSSKKPKLDIGDDDDDILTTTFKRTTRKSYVPPPLDPFEDINVIDNIEAELGFSMDFGRMADNGYSKALKELKKSSGRSWLIDEDSEEEKEDLELIDEKVPDASKKSYIVTLCNPSEGMTVDLPRPLNDSKIHRMITSPDYIKKHTPLILQLIGDKYFDGVETVFVDYVRYSDDKLLVINSWIILERFLLNGSRYVLSHDTFLDTLRYFGVNEGVFMGNNGRVYDFLSYDENGETTTNSTTSNPNNFEYFLQFVICSLTNNTSCYNPEQLTHTIRILLLLTLDASFMKNFGNGVAKGVFDLVYVIPIERVNVELTNLAKALHSFLRSNSETEIYDLHINFLYKCLLAHHDPDRRMLYLMKKLSGHFLNDIPILKVGCRWDEKVNGISLSSIEPCVEKIRQFLKGNDVDYNVVFYWGVLVDVLCGWRSDLIKRTSDEIQTLYSLIRKLYGNIHDTDGSNQSKTNGKQLFLRVSGVCKIVGEEKKERGKQDRSILTFLKKV